MKAHVHSSPAIVPERLLQQLYQFIIERMGWSFPEHRRNELVKRLPGIAKALGFTDPEQCVRYLLSVPWSTREIQTLASFFTVGETYFYRHINDFDTLRKVILPRLIRERQYGNRTLRFWSAGCCTGEEPYTLATYLDECIPNIQDWNITILATDINLHFLEKARKGVYSSWSLRETSAQMCNRYFDREGERNFKIIPRIRTMVKFSYLNLAEPSYPNISNNTCSMDLIFCRNVMIYFALQQIEKVMHHFHASLAPAGSMIVSSSETALVPDIFTREAHQSTILFRKRPEGYRTEKLSDPETGRGVESFFSAPGTQGSSEPACIDWSLLVDGPAPRDSREKSEIPAKKIPAAKENVAGQDDNSIYANALGHYTAGRYDTAASFFLEHIRLHPDHEPVVRALLVTCYANQQEWEQALHWSREYIKGDRFNPFGYYQEAGVFQESGQPAKAISALKQALYIDIDYIPAYVMLGNLMQRSQRKAEAAAYFSTALDLLGAYDDTAVVPDTEGLTAGRMRQFILSVMR